MWTLQQVRQLISVKVWHYFVLIAAQNALSRNPRQHEQRTSNCKINGQFSMQIISLGAILHSFCIFNRKIETKLAFIL